jgi:hypothetical protein
MFQYSISLYAQQIFKILERSPESELYKTVLSALHDWPKNTPQQQRNAETKPSLQTTGKI